MRGLAVPGDLSIGGKDLSIGQDDLSIGQVDLSIGQVDLSIGQVDLSAGQVDLSVGQVDLSVGEIHLYQALPDASRPRPLLFRASCWFKPTIGFYTGQEKSVPQNTNITKCDTFNPMELHEEIRRARKELGLSQDRLAELCGIQRRQLSILERGGNVTLNTLRKVFRFLPNLVDFTFEQVRMKPTYIDYPPFEWTEFYLHMSDFQKSIDGLNTTLKAWLDNPPGIEVDPEVLAHRTSNLATEMVKAYAQAVDPDGEELRLEEERLKREEEELKGEEGE